MTIKEIDEQIFRLKQARKKLEKEEREKFKEEARKNVGRCFKINKKVFVKVIGIPEEKNTMSGVDFNKYQYPAMFIRRNANKIAYFTYEHDEPIFFDTIHSVAWGIGCNIDRNVYEEISPEEFNEELEKVFQELREY